MVCPLLFSTCLCGFFSQGLFPLQPSPTRDPISFPLSAPGPGILEKPASLAYLAICTFTQEMLSASLLGAELWGKHKDERGKVVTGCAPTCLPVQGCLNSGMSFCLASVCRPDAPGSSFLNLPFLPLHTALRSCPPLGLLSEGNKEGLEGWGG